MKLGILVMKLTLREDKAMYTSGIWRAGNNVWNPGDLKNGKHYTQTINLDTAKFPNDVKISWNWPSTGSDVRSYPFVGYGGVEAVQVSNLQSLNVTFDYSVRANGVYNVSFDMWLTNNPGDPWSSGYEIMIVLTPPWGTEGATYTLNSSSLQASVYVNDSWGSGWTFAQAVTVSRVTSGTIDIADLLKSLVWNGVLTGNEYASEVQFGAEIVRGSGTLQINKLSYAPQISPTIKGGTGADTFTMPSSGGSFVDGGAGVDTAIYGGERSGYSVKVVGAEVLIVRDDNISTLDRLMNVEYVQFSDGVFEVGSGIFMSRTVDIGCEWC